MNVLLWHVHGAWTTASVHHHAELSRPGVVADEPVRRGRATGTDLMPEFAAVAPVDGCRVRIATSPAHLGVAPERLAGHEDQGQRVMHRQLGRRRRGQVSALADYGPDRFLTDRDRLLEGETCGSR